MKSSSCDTITESWDNIANWHSTAEVYSVNVSHFVKTQIPILQTEAGGSLQTLSQWSVGRWSQVHETAGRQALKHSYLLKLNKKR